MSTADAGNRDSGPPLPPLDGAVVNQISDHAIFLIDIDGRIATWNRGVREVFGYDESDWCGRSAALLFLDDDIRLGAPEREMTEAATRGRAMCDRWLRRRDGTPLFGIGTLYAIRSETGTLLGYTKVLRDGTRQRQAEDELARMLEVASAARSKADRDAASLDAAFAAIPDGVAISDADGVQRCNPAGLEILGLPSMSALPDSKPRLIETLRIRETRDGPLLDAGSTPLADVWHGQTTTARLWITRPAGDDVCLAIRVAPIVVGDSVAGTVAVFTDTTRQQQEEHRQREFDRVQTVLRARDQELRALVEGVREYAIFTIGTDGLISSWPEGAQRMKGYTSAEAIGMSFENLFTEEEQRVGQPAREMRIAAETGAYQGEGVRIRKNREVFDAHVVLTALRSPNGDLLGYLKLTQDITARRRQERDQREALRAAESARADAERVSRSMGEFLATISHELRTPLSAILGWAAVLGRKTRAGDFQRGVDAITRNARIQIGLIEDLLDMNRIETGQLRLDMQRVDPATVVAGAIEAVQPAARAKGLRLQSRSGSGVRTIAGDAARLQQVVWNLLTNAVKFTDAGGTVNVELSEVDDSVQLVVSDTGQGIEPDFLPHLFDRFRQQDATSTRRHGGLGLGLAIVKQLTELHGGTIRAESAGPGQGSTFTVMLPGRAELVPGDAPLPSAGAVAVPVAGGDADQRLAGARVLLVDDDDDVREVAALVLRSAGAEVVLAADATTAYAAFGRSVPDVLVSDIGMPGHDGYELLGWIRALDVGRGRQVPALAFTAYAAVDDRRRCLAAGFGEQLVKPVEPDALVDAVHALWRQAIERR